LSERKTHDWNCDKCLYWDAGYCKKKPPVLVVGNDMGGFPKTVPFDWCGEYVRWNTHTVETP